MSLLKDAIQLDKRRNFAAKFEISFLTADQLIELGERLTNLPEDEANTQREAFIADKATLKLTIGGMAPADMGRAHEEVRDAIPELSKINDVDPYEKQHIASRFMHERRDAFWPLIVRAIEKAELRHDDKWVAQSAADAKEYVQYFAAQDSTLSVKMFVVNRFLDAFDKDKEARAADPESFRPGV